MTELIIIAVYLLCGFLVGGVWLWADDSEQSIVKILPAMVVIFWPIMVPLVCFFAVAEKSGGPFSIIANFLRWLEKRGGGK